MNFKLISQFYFNSRLTAHDKKKFRHFRHIQVRYRLQARITSCRNHDRHLCLQSYKKKSKSEVSFCSAEVNP